MSWKQILVLSVLIGALVCVLGLFYLWSFQPGDENVKLEFLEKNPTFEVVGLYVGEGNFDFATYHINYRKPNDGKIYEHIETYQRCSGNDWKIECQNLKK